MNWRELFLWLICAAGGFLSGSIMFSRLIPKLLLGKDVCEIGKDRNPGAGNVFVSCGPSWGAFCLTLDILKGYLPVSIAIRLLGTHSIMFAVVLAAPVLGHAVAPLNSFRGGKCISAAFGSLLALFPGNCIVLLLAGIYIFFSVIVKIPDHRRRSLVVFCLFGLLSTAILLCEGEAPIALGCLIISATAAAKHTKRLSHVPESEADEKQ